MPRMMTSSVWGEVRPRLGSCSNGIAAVGAPMSAIPDVSRFWTAATSNGTYLLTWENFVLGRVSGSVREGADETVNAQIELKRNGDFITRSNDVESVYCRVIELKNGVDPNEAMSLFFDCIRKFHDAYISVPTSAKSDDESQCEFMERIECARALKDAYVYTVSLISRFWIPHLEDYIPLQYHEEFKRRFETLFE